MSRKALITGITGQDGSYLAEYLLSKGYIVYGIKRRSSSFNTDRIDHLYKDPHTKGINLYLRYGDMTDALSIHSIIKEVGPDEIYNLAAQSHVAVSFETPEYTANCDALGPLRILETVRSLGLVKKTKIYQASTSELYGGIYSEAQTEDTPFHPRSPYAVAKQYAYWITKNYRDAYGLHASNGILFNHESPRRGETFVTRKITRAFAKIAKGEEEHLYMGNLDAKRDWGHAKDYVEAMWKMMQKKIPNDYVIATGKQYSVKQFVNLTLKELRIKYYWKGKGIKSKCFDENGDCIVACDKEYFRPLEVDTLLGNSRKAKKELNWKPKIGINALVKEMVNSELLNLKDA